jgi:UDP-N-acetylmuramyl-tripeptide synthetase
LAAAVKTKCITVSVEKPGDLFCTQVEDTIQGLSATLKFSEKLCQIRSNLIGRFNLENILCAAGAAVAVNIPFLSILKGIEALKGVPGRLERICEQSGRFVFVDYAHTPDALESILATLKERAPSRLITVFGCGGDRDRAKRPMMGAIALKYSNLALATSDNPRSEDPEVIIQDILKGMDSPSRKTYGLDDIENGFDLDGYAVEPDRTRALRMAVRISKPGDTIVAAGKGHETYQVLKTGTIHFDDREVLRKAVADFNLVEVTP